MPSVDFETLTRPISASDPCGPDLDAEGDIDFLNFFASVESVLPQSYFRARDPAGGELRLFDPKMIAFEQYFANAKPFLEKTRDIRLTVMLAKLSILNRDLNGFVACLKALAALLALYWDDVHPKGEAGDFAYRGIALEALDVAPTVTMPLQFLPLVHDHRLGAVSHRNYLTASGAVPAAEGEPTPELAAVERILDSCELGILTDLYSKFQDILGATEQFRAVWSEKNPSGESLSFGQLSGEASAIARWLGDAIKRRSPGVDIDEDIESSTHTAGGELAQTKGDVTQTGPVRSTAQAVAALAAVARYYGEFEPSSPARLLISLSEQMIGKTFAEIVRILAPQHVEQAVIKIGTNSVLELPVERIAEPLNGTAPAAADQESPVQYTVANRAQALATIDQISAFFRLAEPSSPIPVLLERIRDLGQRDFLNLLRSVLPADALKARE